MQLEGPSVVQMPYESIAAIKTLGYSYIYKTPGGGTLGIEGSGDYMVLISYAPINTVV
jgi:hypothetical protein